MFAFEIHQDMTNTSKDIAFSETTVKGLIQEFKQGRTSVDDEARSRRPYSATRDDTLYLIMVTEDRRLTTRQ